LDGLAKALRNGTPSVFGRIQKDRLLLDLRSVFPRQDLELVEAVRRLGTAVSEAESAEPPVSDIPDDDIGEG
jgi:hypothetical protein